MAALNLTNVCKSFSRDCVVLDGVSFSLEAGEFVALIGQSGSGKSTLLRCISGLMNTDPASSSIQIFGQNIQTNGKISARIRWLRRDIGFVFQQFNLVDRLPLIVNVLTGALGRIPWYRAVLGLFLPSEYARARAALTQVGLFDYAWQRTSSLSGGQQQRGAIARVLVQDAKLVLADEPIASLDPVSVEHVMDLLLQLNQKCGMTVLISLHQVEIARRYCKRAIVLRSGKIMYDGPMDGLTPMELKNFYTQHKEAA